MKGYRLRQQFYKRRLSFGAISLSAISVSRSGSYILADYSVSGGVEKNQSPEISDIVRTGTMEAGQVQTFTITYKNNSPYSIGSVSLAIYASGDNKETNKSLVTTVTSFSDDGVDTITVSYTLLAAQEGKWISAVGNITLDGGLNKTSEDFSSFNSEYPNPVYVESAFTGISVRYEDMVFDGGDGSDLASVQNRGTWGTVVTPAWTNDPTNDTTNSALKFTKTEEEAIEAPHPAFGASAGYTIGFVIYLPAHSATRHITALSGSKNIRLDLNESVFMNGIDTTVDLAEATWVAVRCFFHTTGNAYIQVNKTAKTTVASLNDTGIGFSGTFEIGSKDTVANPLEGSLKFFGVHDGAVADVDWDAIVDKYIV